jgi:peptidyl-prolyl cis-trans isomerase D
MLERIREHTTGWIAWVVIGLIIFAMAFFGIEQYFQTRIETYSAKIESAPSWWRDAPSEGAAGGIVKSLFWETNEISQQEFRQRFDRYREQARLSAGESYDAAQVETLETKRLVLDGLVDEKILELAALRDGVSVDAAQVKKAILDVDGITQDGKYIGDDAYKIWLQSRGLTAAGFEALVRRQILTGAMPDSVRDTALVGEAELDALLKLQQETRDLRYVEVPLLASETAMPDDAAIAAWHASHGDRYRTEETVALSYFELDATQIPVSAAPTEDDLRARYEQEKTRFGTEEERSAAHILINVAADADAAAVEAARVKAEAIAQRARVEGADFAALAAEASEDLGTKDAGGDLGPIGKDQFPKPFEDAVFALASNQVSDPVRTDQGWHVIKLTNLIEGTLQPFEAVRAQLESEFADAERERLFNEKSGQLVDAILRSPASLTTVAAEMGVEVQNVPAFTRNTGEGVAAIEAVRAAAFSRPQKDDLQVSDPVEIGQNQVLVLQVTEHVHAAVRPIAEVRDQIVGDILADAREKAARAQADALLARARKGETLEAIALELGVTAQESLALNRQSGTPDSALVREGFRLKPLVAGEAADVGLASLAGGRFALVVATKSSPGDLAGLTPEIRTQILQQLAQMRGEMERAAFVKSLRDQFTITVAEERL